MLRTFDVAEGIEFNSWLEQTSEHYMWFSMFSGVTVMICYL